MQGYPQEIADFVKAIREDRQPVASWELAREVMIVLYAAYVTAEEGCRVDLRRSCSGHVSVPHEVQGRGMPADMEEDDAFLILLGGLFSFVDRRRVLALGLCRVRECRPTRATSASTTAFGLALGAGTCFTSPLGSAGEWQVPSRWDMTVATMAVVRDNLVALYGLRQRTWKGTSCPPPRRPRRLRHAANLHMPGYRQLGPERCEVVAVCGHSQERARPIADKHGIPHAFGSLTEMLASVEVDAVDLVVPNHVHRQYAIEAAQAGKHLIVEKPLTGYFGESDTPEDEMVGHTVPKQHMLERVVEDCDAILAAVKAAGVKLCYAENWCYAPAFTKLRRLVNVAGGTIIRIEAEESHSGSTSIYAQAAGAPRAAGR